ncbi:MAG: HDOD domain-containing protein [Candidatus Brocadiia bacterium]|jgi:EAL and modified HD-GYP domain-containing signal transduction protein
MGSLAATTAPGSAGAAGVASAASVANTAKGAGVSLSRVFIARQPIFDVQQKVYGYELLFRSGPENVFKHAEPDQASAKVMTDGTLILSMEAISGGKLVFINVTRNILLNDYISLLPRDLTAAEILETIEPDREVVGACSRLKKAGYMIVLDDFVYGEQYADLMNLADIVKVDFLSTSAEERRQVLSRFTGPNVRFLAEKVETHEVFKEASGLGYSYFQGYFFSKPVIVSSRDVPGFKLNYLQMLQEIQLPGVNFHHLEAIIKRDMALSFKLLRYINSAYFGLSNKVSSIMHAITLLGAREFKQWASLVVMASMGSDKPDELVVQALIRGRFCESLAPMLGMKQRSQELFLLGMFSVIDAILDRPLEEILKDLPLSDEIKDALTGKPNRLRAVFDYVLAYEKGDWNHLTEMARALGLDESDIPAVYWHAVHWAQKSFGEVNAAV